MSSTARPSRRQVFALLLSSVASTTLARHTFGQPRDQGIGGTGAAPPTADSDRGIGGTGVIGTIRKFGSIIVNDMRIAYPPDAEVRIDGRPATVRDLKIGQVVRVTAAGAQGGLSTRAIDVTSEVVGQVEFASAKQIKVLGQTVSTAGLKRRDVKVGDTVAVSGLRRNDGTIVASLVEPRDGAESRVSGPVRLAPDGALRIGGLALAGTDASLVDRRALIEGTREGDRFVVTRAIPESALFPPEVRNLSIESYVERRGDRLALGSGFDVAGSGTIDLPAGRSTRAVISTTIRPDGTLTVDRVQTNGRTYAPVGSGQRGGLNLNQRTPGGSGNGRIPMDFGRGPTGGRGIGGQDLPGSPGGAGLPGGGPFGGGGIGGGGIGGGGIGGGLPGGGLPGGGLPGGFGGRH